MSGRRKVKFTFKTERPTGRYRSFYSSNHIIKLKKIPVGMIYPSGLDSPPFSIHLQVIKKDLMEDGNKNCEWRWK